MRDIDALNAQFKTFAGIILEIIDLQVVETLFKADASCVVLAAELSF